MRSLMRVQHLREKHFVAVAQTGDRLVPWTEIRQRREINQAWKSLAERARRRRDGEGRKRRRTETGGKEVERGSHVIGEFPQPRARSGDRRRLVAGDARDRLLRPAAPHHGL